MAITATESLQSSVLTSTTYSYSLTLHDTGTTTIGTFWFAWNPSQNYLLSTPLTTTAPTGWTVAQVSHGGSDGYGIEFVADSSADYLAAGASLAGFGFTSADTPAEVTGPTKYYPDTLAIDSFVYAGAAFASASFEIQSLACFAGGTRLRTEAGDMAVEDLRVGQRLATAGPDGAAWQAITWIGHRRVACGRHPRPRAVWPVRIAAHAFGPGRPARALLLSPDHAVFCDGVLMPVRCLIDGDSIAQQKVDAVTYWHVELARHDVVLAEGLPCESFLDTGNRMAFANSGPIVPLHPDFAARTWAADACAELHVAGPRVAAARAMLAASPPAPAARQGAH